MFANALPPVTSVTYFDGDPPSLVELRRGLDFHDRLASRSGFAEWSLACQKAIKTGFEQKRLDKSASSAAVRWLLNAAKSGGMGQREFELAAAELRPNGGRGVGFNGRLWHHYMTTDARMSLSVFDEYFTYFFDKGWITESQHREARLFLKSSTGMLNCVKTEKRDVREAVKNNPGLMSLDAYLFVLANAPASV